MVIQWYGHSCFMLELEDKRKIVFDPYNEKIGYAPIHLQADLVLISHSHYDHAHLSAVEGTYTTLRHVGEYKLSGITVKGIHSFHDKEGGRLKGHNIIFVVDAEGIRICHCGDLGHIIDNETAANIGSVDYLLLPVGGNYTVDAHDAMEIAEKIGPRTIIPMHYKTKDCNLNLDNVEPFLELAHGKSIKHEGSRLKFTTEYMYDIAVMDYR